MKGNSAGKVTLLDADPHSSPIIDPRYVSDTDGHDHAVLSEARQLMSEITRVPDLATLLGPAADAPATDLAEGVVNYCHPAGTCKLGPPQDPRAVVGHDGSTYGVDGLHIADASIMPTITRGNINLPTAAIAARVVSFALGIAPAELGRRSAAPAHAQLD